MRRVAMLSLSVVVGCASASQGDLNDLERKHELEKARLVAVQAEIARQERLAAAARERAEIAQCEALNAEIQASVAIERTTCERAVADRHRCEANNSAHTANAGMIGCGLGIGAAIATGGAAGPLAVVGCASGAAAGHATTDHCAAVTCDLSPERLATSALQKRNLTTMPVYGHRMGAHVSEAAGGVLVGSVTPGSVAGAMGLQAGDLVREVDGIPTPNTAALHDQLNTKITGQPFAILVQRGAQVLVLRGLMGPLAAAH